MKFITYYPSAYTIRKATTRQIYEHCYWLSRWITQRSIAGDRKSVDCGVEALFKWVMSHPTEAHAAMKSHNAKMFNHV